MKFSIAAFLLLTSFVGSLFAQKTITGNITDESSGDFLPSANIQIEGTLQGTISNDQGQFQIKMDQMPATLIIRYIGYEIKKVVITDNSSSHIAIKLKPSSIDMEGVVVLGEDPAVKLLRGVIEKKKRWHKLIQNFHAESYARFSMENDSGIVMVGEMLSETYWHREKGLRTIIKSKRYTKNVDPKANVLIGDPDLVNLYDDDVPIQGSRFIGVTHPDALNYYEFKITGKRYLSERLVYDVEVLPKTRLQPVFVGSIAIEEGDSIMLEAVLRPSDATVFPVPFESWKVFYSQQFNNFGRQYWLPVDVRMLGAIKIGFPGLQFPSIKYSQVSAFNNYSVNISIPDSIFANKKMFLIDSLAIKKENQFDSSSIIIPMSDREDSAFKNIKRGQSLAKAFQPTGLLSKMVKSEDDFNDSVADPTKKKKFPLDFLPDVGFNRVEGGRVGVITSYEMGRTAEFAIRLGMAIADKTPFYGAESKFYFGRRRAGNYSANFYRGIFPRYDSDNYPNFFYGLPALVGERDYADYYDSRQLKLAADYEFSKIDLEISGHIVNERMTSVATNTSFDIVGRKNHARLNPRIEEGTLNAVGIKIVYGDEFVPLGFIGSNNVELRMEHSPSVVSDFNYTTYRGAVTLKIPTFLKRRFIPNTLDVRAVAGTYTGHLPIQKNYVLDGGLVGFTPFATFRTLRNRALEAPKYAAVFAEHNFRSLPFELVGLNWFAKKNIGLIVFGSTGKTWINSKTSTATYLGQKSQTLSEWGGSISGIFGLFRVDVAQNLRTKNVYFGVGGARLF